MWRRRLIRAKSRNNLDRMTQSAGELTEARKELKRAIGKAKRNAWDELLEELNGNPWGRPYRAIMNKMKAENSNIGMQLSVEAMDGILDVLFPNDRGVNVYRSRGNTGTETIPEITGEEMSVIRRTIRKGNKASGPDGVQGKLVAEAQLVAETVYRGLYDGCLRTGIFPDRWKIAR